MRGCLQIALALLMSCCAAARAEEPRKSVFLGVGSYQALGFESNHILVGAELEHRFDNLVLSLAGDYSATPKRDAEGFNPTKTFSITTSGDAYLRLGKPLDESPTLALLAGCGVRWAIGREPGYFKGVARPKCGLALDVLPDGDVRLRVGAYHLFAWSDNFNELRGGFATLRLDVPFGARSGARVYGDVGRVTFQNGGERFTGTVGSAHWGFWWER